MGLLSLKGIIQSLIYKSSNRQKICQASSEQYSYFGQHGTVSDLSFLSPVQQSVGNKDGNVLRHYSELREDDTFKSHALHLCHIVFLIIPPF